MKRSRRIALVAMGTAALSLTACGESEEPIAIYADAADCARDTANTADDCRNAENAARQKHWSFYNTAGHDTQAACEERHGPGNCEPVPRPWQAKFAGYEFRGQRYMRAPDCAAIGEATWVKHCETMLGLDLRRHFEQAPKYRTRDECELKHPAGCEQPEAVAAAASRPGSTTSTSTSTYRPSWTSFYFFGRNGLYSVDPTPLFRSSRPGHFTNYDGGTIAATRGVQNARSSFVRSSGTTSRSGFGSSSRSHGSSSS